jgi:hypothetical protein
MNKICIFCKKPLGGAFSNQCVRHATTAYFSYHNYKIESIQLYDPQSRLYLRLSYLSNHHYLLSNNFKILIEMDGIPPDLTPDNASAYMYKLKNLLVFA